MLDSQYLDEKIVEAVKRHWEECGRPLLLSSLGNRDDPPIARLMREHGTSLLKYIQTRLSDRVQLIQDNNNSLVYALAPAGVLFNPSDIVSTPRRRPEEATKRYRGAIWAAFCKPLDSTKRRYVKTKGPLHFKDIESSATEPDSSYVEVIKDEIVPEPREKHVVEKSIIDWVSKHDLKIEQFMMTPVVEGANSLLSRLVNVLAPEDLRRIAIPLDIVSKLLRHPR